MSARPKRKSGPVSTVTSTVAVSGQGGVRRQFGGLAALDADGNRAAIMGFAVERRQDAAIVRRAPL